MKIDAKDEIPETKIKELENKNREEIESLDKLIILFEDVKNIESSNLDYASEILKEVSFKDNLIIGKLGNLCKTYFKSYYDTKIKLTENLKKIIDIMRLKSDESNDNITQNDKKSFEIPVYSSDFLFGQKYIGEKDIEKIIGSMPLINEFNDNYTNNYKKYLETQINEIKLMDDIKELNIIKTIKEEKIIFEQKIEDICTKGTNSANLKDIQNELSNDNSDEQEKLKWTINYLNKYRAKLSIVEENVYQSFKILFDIIFKKLEEKQLYQIMDLAIILIQTFSKNENGNNILLENEFKNYEIFKNNKTWINLILQKTKDLLSKIPDENKDNIQYIKENMEPMLASVIFTMKDFVIDENTIKKVIMDFCETEENKKYKFEIDNLMSYLVC